MTPPVAFQPLLPFDAEPAATPAPPSPVEELARACREHPLDEKVLVAPSLAIGHQLVERLAREGTPWIHLRVETVRTLAHAVVGPDLARGGWRLLSRAQALALVEQACAEALGPDSYFGQLFDRPGLHRALQSTLDELRAAGLAPDRLPAGAFADRKKHRELQDVFRRHAAALEAGRSVDGIEVLRRARQALDTGASPFAGPIYLLPAATELSPLEREFLELLAADRLVELASDPPEAWTVIARGARLLRSTGEENEIREIFRRILHDGAPWDSVEILHTDPSVYPALVWELSREHAIPCTFAGGIAVSFTRPGRAAFAFLDWIGEGFSADVLREALASGSLTLERLEGVEDARAGHAAARALREAGIGWGRERHRSGLDRLIAELERPEPRRPGEEEGTEEQQLRRSRRRSRRLDAARQARQFVRRALELAPVSLEEPGDLRGLARDARTFVRDFGRVSDELDATARTALEALFRELEELRSPRLTAAASVERLHAAVAGLSIGADRPRPGRVHVAFFGAGGFSGRPRTFLAGLDEGRHPGRDLEDPILLDEERRRINDDLPAPRLALGRERPREASAALRACLSRLRGELTASYSSFGLRNLSQAGEPAPSPFFLDLYRQSTGRPGADYSDLAAALPCAAGFLPGTDDALDETEWWLSRLRGADPAAAAPAVRAGHPWLQQGRLAELARESDEFTAWDGWVRSGTPELDPRAGGEPFSASRIQKLAQCPFAYFVRHVLRVEPPDDLARDPARWLEPMDEGTLLHEVFRVFFERITEAGEKPEVARHLDTIESVARERIAQWSERIPPRSRVAFDEQSRNILFACRTLLKLEEQYCRSVTPRFFEVPFGLRREAGSPGSPVASPDPVEIAMGGGRKFLLRGSIDRVDEAPDGTFHVWDYKTGSAWAVREGSGLRGGRQIQPALYAMAFDSLLARAGLPGSVSKTGYFFPGHKGEGRRIWSVPEAGPARRVLGTLFDLLQAGMFPHAVSKDDCKHCDFETICGGASTASERASTKLAESQEPALAAFREIHATED